jgi:hypothetical protein
MRMIILKLMLKKKNESGDWINLAQDRDQGSTVENTVMNPRVTKNKLRISWSIDHQLLKRTGVALTSYSASPVSST